MSSKELQREFLYNSIQDTVSTIRAIDTKLQIVLGVFLVPLALIDKLVEAICYWCSRWDWNTLCGLQWVTAILSLVAAAVWFSGVVVSLRGIIALANPANAVPATRDKPAGTFYYVGKLKGWFRPKLIRTLEDHMGKLPNDDAGIVRELAFEQMKLGFIRDIKMRRHRISAFTAVVWGVLVVVTAVMYHVAIRR